MRAALPLSRLEIRRDRAVRRSSLGARRDRHAQPDQAEILSLHRARRDHLDLYGAAGIEAGAAGIRMGAGAARATLHLETPAGMQLPASGRRRYRFEPRLLP